MELSIRAYAKHRGVTEGAVRKAIKQGRISKKNNGKIDPNLADKEWSKNTDPAQIKKTENQEQIEEKINNISTPSNPLSVGPF